MRGANKEEVEREEHTQRDIYAANVLGAGVLVESTGTGEHHETNLGIAQNCQLLGLLEEAAAALGERDLAAGGVVDASDHDLPSAHLGLKQLGFLARSKRRDLTKH